MILPLDATALLCGAITGGFAGAVVPAADGLLVRKGGSFAAYHREMAQATAAHIAEHGSLPDRKAKGEEGALGYWYSDCATASATGDLTKEAADAMRDAGLEVPEGACRNSGRIRYRAAAGIGLQWLIFLWIAAVGAVALVLPGGDTLRWAWAAGGMAIAAVIALCDSRALVIPWETAAALAAIGTVYAAASAGWSRIPWMLLASAGIWAATCVIVRFASAGRPGALGGGDKRAIPACAMYLGIGGSAGIILQSVPLISGAAAASAVYVAYLLLQVARGRKGMKESTPMAAFFAMWLSFGVVAACL